MEDGNTEEQVGLSSEAQFASSSQPLHIPVDENCTLAGYQVYVDPSNGIIYDASLNQTNAANNNNKFYRIQLLQGPSQRFKTWTSWGRVGEHGQGAVLGNGTIADAMSHFEKKFKDKSGLPWSNRLDTPILKKYVYIEKSYEPDSDDSDEEQPHTKVGAGQEQIWSPPECTLAPQVKSLMELIFNQTYFEAAMISLQYDVNKLPLGKLSKTTISRGYQVLKDLSNIIDNPSSGHDIENLSNLYYSLIPHSFGRVRPPVIWSFPHLKKEVELLDSLSDLKAADDIIKAGRETHDNLHPLDFRFKSLGMQEMTPLARDTTEFVEIEQYLKNTCGQTHNFTYQVQDVFRIERDGELDRFWKSPFAGIESDRRLLWHGSRATNFGGILSQGLRIAPPEAPVNGYMFDKGIYLADMSSKSAGYCCAHDSGRNALLLLCEAELGKPMLILQDAMCNASEEAKNRGAVATWGQGTMGPKAWKDARCVHPSLAGVSMPDSSQAPEDMGIANTDGRGRLLYNEYICYNVAQVRLRYLLRVLM
ncbi:hypothetical protein M433DRAFT_66746 [Acidomyces richmondensis BFW]|nr:MAG: hypothetical protein FE78DRAFT_167429 [Acidomyces sp. 'richmondensis']KYG45698.1 hypothetical protein M433DRAFT_66746 [Acidomyces richmondensis BFW]